MRRFACVLAIGIALPEALLSITVSAQAVAIDGQTTDGTSSISRLQIYTTASVGAVGQISILQSRLQFGSAGYFRLPNYASDPTGPQAGDLFLNTTSNVLKYYTTSWQTLVTSSGATFTSSVAITPTTNQLVLGTTNTVTINATAPSLSRTYTIPDAGADDSFVMLAATQTLTNKTWNGSTIGGAYGGTGATSVGSGGSVAYSNGTAYAFTAVGTTNQVLTSQAAAAPTWTTLGGGVLPVYATLVNVSGAQTVYYGGNTTGIEANRQFVMPKCTLKRFRVYVYTSNLNSSSTFTLRLDGVATSLAVTFGASATGAQTATGSVSCADGQSLSVEAVQGGTSGQNIAVATIVVNYDLVP